MSNNVFAKGRGGLCWKAVNKYGLGLTNTAPQTNNTTIQITCIVSLLRASREQGFLRTIYKNVHQMLQLQNKIAGEERGGMMTAVLPLLLLWSLLHRS